MGSGVHRDHGARGVGHDDQQLRPQRLLIQGPRRHRRGPAGRLVQCAVLQRVR